jgi:hypothetical protein
MDLEICSVLLRECYVETTVLQNDTFLESALVRNVMAVCVPKYNQGMSLFREEMNIC